MATPGIDCDVAIVGGGLVGASLALALADSRLRIALIEAQVPDEAAAHASFDDRTTALGNSSRRIFEQLGVWAAVAPEAAAIRCIHVSDAGRFGFARLRAAEQGIEAFGYVVGNRSLGRALWAPLRQAARAGGVMLRAPERVLEAGVEEDAVCLVTDAGVLRTRLAVAADGAGSALRRAAGIEAGVADYGQVAIVARACTDQPADGTAWERFTREGPIAVLPLASGEYGVIRACARERAAGLLALTDAEYLAALQASFGWRAGCWLKVSARAGYPLALTRAERAVAPRVVLLGNAAQALHPVAGQGFNLGLRDVALLAESLVEAARAGADPGDPVRLEAYARARGGDRRGVIGFTDALVRGFGDERPGVGLLRNLGLLAFDLTPAAKRALARVSTGFSGPVPRLARGLPL